MCDFAAFVRAAAVKPAEPQAKTNRQQAAEVPEHCLFWRVFGHFGQDSRFFTQPPRQVLLAALVPR